MKYFNPSNNNKGRNKKKRIVSVEPISKDYFSQNNNLENETIILNYDEIETLKLKNIDNLGIIEWSKQMWISKSLFALIYKQAMQKISKCLIWGKNLHINTEDSTNIEIPTGKN